MVTQQSLAHGRRAGILCSLGIALGLSVHIIYSAAGLAALITQSTFYLTLIKLLAAIFLIYMGIKGIFSKQPQIKYLSSSEEKQLSTFKSVARGFICNTLNPKAPLYFLSVFTLVLSPDMPLYQLIIIGLWIMMIQFIWFTSVALVLSKPVIRKKFQSIGHWVDRVMGSIMLVFGLRILLSRT